MLENKKNGDAVLNSIAQHIKTCKKCRLWERRTYPVPGEGSAHVRLMLIGEAPGRMEDETGRPFVGKAGKLLDNALILGGLKRTVVYITNVVKCRPPGNRNPSEDECNTCAMFLNAQIRCINPNVIVTLGNVATSVVLPRYLFNPQTVGRIHGNAFNSAIHGVSIIPTYHPAACIYNPALKDDFLKDILKAISYHNICNNNIF